jgi:hypothetical protein
VEEAAKTNGKTNGKKHPKGKWEEEKTYELTLNTMFYDGPVCLWIIAHNKCTHMQNNFLFNTAMFLRKKYEINWEEALTWVNYNVLKPVGEREKLNSLIKRKPDKNYLCDQEPICSHCNSHACRKMDYGVGQNGTSIDVYELGLTALNRLPRIYFANLGNGDEEIRMQMTSNELRKLDRFKDKCMDHGLPIPLVENQKAWEKIVNKNLESATLVEPSHIMRTNAAELDLLMKFFGSRIKTFLRQGEKEDDQVRVRPEERRIYFKEQRIIEWCRWERLDVDRMVSFIHNNCEHHHQGRGNIRKWWRFTYSISYDMIDEDKLEEWFNEENGDKESGHAV